jgi:hypothetical protein
MLRGSKIAVMIGAGLFLAGPAPAQAPGEITLFSQPNQRGQSFVVTGPRDNLRSPGRCGASGWRGAKHGIYAPAPIIGFPAIGSSGTWRT